MGNLREIAETFNEMNGLEKMMAISCFGLTGLAAFLVLGSIIIKLVL